MRQPDYILRREAVYCHCLNDRAVKNPVLVGASIARPLLAGAAIRIRIVRIVFAAARPAAAGELFAFKSCLSLLRQPDYILRREAVYCHCLNDRAVKNPVLVGASIARPLLAGAAIRIRIVRIVFAAARPVRSASVVLMPQYIFGLTKNRCALSNAESPCGNTGRPMAAPTGAVFKPHDHLENENAPTTSAGYNRADAKATRSILNADRRSAKTRFT